MNNCLKNNEEKQLAPNKYLLKSQTQTTQTKHGWNTELPTKNILVLQNGSASKFKMKSEIQINCSFIAIRLAHADGQSSSFPST